MTGACGDAFVGLGLEGVGALDDNGLVDEQADAFGEAVSALFGDKLQDVVQAFRIGLAGHVWFGVGCVCDTPT